MYHLSLFEESELFGATQSVNCHYMYGTTPGQKQNIENGYQQSVVGIFVIMEAVWE
jgi:hypothetical protein